MAVLTTRVQRFFHLFLFLSTTSEKSFIPYKNYKISFFSLTKITRSRDQFWATRPRPQRFETKTGTKQPKPRPRPQKLVSRPTALDSMIIYYAKEQEESPLHCVVCIFRIKTRYVILRGITKSLTSGPMNVENSISTVIFQILTC